MSACANSATQNQIESASRTPQILLTSGLLAKRRTRSRNSNSSSANSLSYELSPLCIPPPSTICRSPHRPIAGQSETIRHVQAVERDLAEIALICLRIMVFKRMGPDNLAQAQSMMQEETGSGGAAEMPSQSNMNSAAPVSAGLQNQSQSLASNLSVGIPSPTGIFSGIASSNVGDSGVGGACASCRANVLLARRLVAFADEFSRNRRGRRAVDCASGLPLPPNLIRSDFDIHLSTLLVSTGAMRSKVALLLLICAELAVKAALLCNRIALATVQHWCQEIICSMASAFVMARGWNSLITDESKVAFGPWHPIAFVLALMLIGCTLSRVFARR